jgi:hypothetical protein
MILPGWGTAVGAVVGGAIGFFKGKGEGKKANEAQRLAQERLETGETTRQTRVAAGANLLEGLRAKGFTPIDEGTANKMLERRDVSKLVGDPLAGGGSSNVGDALQTVMDYGTQYGMNVGADGGAGSSYLGGLSAGQPVGGLRGSFQDTLGGGSGGVGAGQGAVNLDDLKDLYKLGGSGTQDFG